MQNNSSLALKQSNRYIASSTLHPDIATATLHILHCINYIASITLCPEHFKFALDNFLKKRPDELNVSGFGYTLSACNKITGKASNALVDQTKTVKTWGNLQVG